MILFILGFMFNLLWIIGAVMYYNHSNVEARRWGRFSLYAFIFTLVATFCVIAIFFIIPIFFFVVAALAGALNGPRKK